MDSRIFSDVIHVQPGLTDGLVCKENNYAN